MDLRYLKIWFLFGLSTLIASTTAQVRAKRQAPGVGEPGQNRVYEKNILGKAGIDYPLYAAIPPTQFRCNDYDFAGYFADVETGCQVYRVCFPDGRNASFLCINGTVFNQRRFVCDWWYRFNCQEAPSLYHLNAFRRLQFLVLPPVARLPYVRPTSPPKREIPLELQTTSRTPKERLQATSRIPKDRLRATSRIPKERLRTTFRTTEEQLQTTSRPTKAQLLTTFFTTTSTTTAGPLALIIQEPRTGNVYRKNCVCSKG